MKPIHINDAFVEGGALNAAMRLPKGQKGIQAATLARITINKRNHYLSLDELRSIVIEASVNLENYLEEDEPALVAVRDLMEFLRD